ncbi:competence/damage-inducible protein A [Tenacibaculum geojense]|uniref:CinA-like protein n=1 Tax=Tenacibaculum geojense TaxID=915352 RepID=A0ABW3JVH2_9FLAO
MNAEIITIGDEILIGQIVDTNSQWIATELNKIGVSVYQISSIQDEKEHILNALKEAESRADLVIITGGLGPTKDDITKITLANYFNDTLVLNEKVVTHVQALFAKYDIPFGELNKQQGLMPTKATWLHNKLGTAPGMWFYENNTVFISLPGVPYEMKGLITNEVIPRIREQFKLPFIFHKTLLTYGLGESSIAERIEDFENSLPNYIKLAYLPALGRVRLRLTAKGNEKDKILDEITSKANELALLVADIFTGYEGEGSIEAQLGDLLKQRNQTIATAESLTGGKIASSLVAVPGASQYFKGGLITYTAELKQQLLGVSETTIKKHTVVSKQVAEEMALGAQQKLQTDYAISVTGNAGPTTDENDKEVGLVYIGIATTNGVEVHEFNFGQPREKVINRTVAKAVELTRKIILKN